MGGAGDRSIFRTVLSWTIPAALLLIALLFWGNLLPRVERSVFGRAPILDEIYYLDQAALWANDSGPPDEAFFVTPLYPLVLALVGRHEGVPDSMVFAPGQLRGIRVFQILCWLGVVGLLRLTAGRLLDLEAGPARDLAVWLPALLFALYRPTVVYTVSVLLEMPLMLLLAGAAYLMVLLHDADRKGNHFPLILGLGVVIGLAGLLRGTALVLLAPGVWVAARRVTWSRALLTVAAALAVLTPAVIHNSRISGRVVGPTLNGGVNFYIGNGPQANGFYVAVVPGDWREDPAGRHFLKESLGTALPSLAEADRFWAREAWKTVAARPARAAGLWCKKVWLHLQGWEIDQLAPLDGWRRSIPVLNWLPVPYALLVVLALAGGVGRWSDGRVRLLAVCGLALVAGQSLFFVVSRYRVALVPLLCLLAVMGAREIARGNRRAVVAGVLGVLLVIPWGLAGTRSMWRAQAKANEALRWAEVGQEDDSGAASRRAESLYREALAENAEGPAPWLGLAALLVARGERAEADSLLSVGAAATPRNLDINKTLLALRLEDGRRTEALALTAAILSDYPRDPDTMHNRTILLAEAGLTAEAAALANQLVAAHPADARGYVDLGIILAREGRTDEARAVFVRGLEAVPDDSRLKRNLEILDR